jgi:hypothetical protein
VLGRGIRLGRGSGTWVLKGLDNRGFWRNGAAGEGFEPSGRFGRPTVFKTAPFDHSGTPPVELVKRMRSHLAVVTPDTVWPIVPLLDPDDCGRR